MGPPNMVKNSNSCAKNEIGDIGFYGDKEGGGCQLVDSLNGSLGSAACFARIGCLLLVAGFRGLAVPLSGG